MIVAPSQGFRLGARVDSLGEPSFILLGMILLLGIRAMLPESINPLSSAKVRLELLFLSSESEVDSMYGLERDSYSWALSTVILFPVTLLK